MKRARLKGTVHATGVSVDTKVSLVLTCVDCPAQLAVPVERFSNKGASTTWLHTQGWVLSVLHQDGGVLLRPVCRNCAEKGFDKDLLRAADEHFIAKKPS